MIKITFPDGAVKEFESGTTTLAIAESISKSLAKKALAGKVNGKLVDLTRPIEEDASIEIITPDHEDALGLVRHSAAHLMAQAMRRLYPNIHFGVGPAIDSGFYYDTDNGQNQVTAEDLPAIEAEMMKIVKENLPIERRVLSKQEALEIFASDPYKVELISELPEEEVITAYQQGEFIDLCRGPHVPSTGRIQVFKLLSVAGAQYQGMGKDLYEEAVVKQTFDEASEILGYDMAELCFTENERLDQTQYTQPAILTVSIAYYRLLKEHGIIPDAALGLSLGEYSALVASNALSFTEAVALVAKRGAYMTEAAPAGSGKMVAVMNAPIETIEESCHEASKYGIVSPANYNTPQQIVIGGEEKAVDEAVLLLKEKGFKRMIPLNVSGPFHTAILEPAAKKLAKDLSQIQFSEPSFPIISNTTTEIMKKETIAGLLEQQVMQPVRFYESIHKLKTIGIEQVIEVGPGKVLSGFMKKIDKTIPVLRVENKQTFDETIAIL